ncbi:MAG: PLP-dependent aminotransferase family protein [Anaerolineae bacterium]|jgi:DNA-binding transcriptional MocR family regulator
MDNLANYKYESIVYDLTQLIESGTFRPGDRIPSVRQMSKRRNVSVTTVLHAYYKLEAQGLIRARPCSGFYVRVDLPVGLPEPDVSSPRPDPTTIGVRQLAMMVVRDEQNPDLVQFGLAHPGTDLLPATKLNRAVRTVLREREAHLYDYTPGCEDLRQQTARRALAAGCKLTAEDVVLTSGCSEAISLALRTVCEPGDTVAIESPMCFDALQCLQLLGLRALEIPTHPRDGISLSALREAIAQNEVSACLVVSNFNNPLGSCIPDEKKRQLVQLLTRHEIPLIENDIFGEIYFAEKRPSVAKAYDEEGLVILCSSFSKVLCPGYRLGWTIPGRFTERLRWVKYSTNLATPTVTGFAISEFIRSGGYNIHLRRIRRAYAERVAAMSQSIRRAFPASTKLTRPSGGYLLWVELPESVDSLELYKRALEAGIAIVPGYLFSASGLYQNFIRLNAANYSEEVDWAIGRLGELAEELCPRPPKPSTTPDS